MRPPNAHDRPNASSTARAAAVFVIALAGLAPTAAAASPFSYTGFATIAAPFTAPRPAAHSLLPQQQEEGVPQAPPPRDSAGGMVVSVLGGSVFSGNSTFQGGAAIAYFFGAKATLGFEIEGALTFGPGGRVVQGQGSFIIQTGARTSKFVPFVALGIGYLRAKADLPSQTTEVLASLGINPTPESESAPYFHFGGGVRFYVKPNLSVRGDVRLAQVKLDVPDQSFTDTFPMRRVAVMLSWDF